MAKLAQFMQAMSGPGKRIPLGVYSLNVRPNVAMLVEPVNADPLVFVAPGTVHEFTSQRGNGTDKLRQRALAGMFFERICEAHDKTMQRQSSASAMSSAGEEGEDGALQFTRMRECA